MRAIERDGEGGGVVLIFHMYIVTSPKDPTMRYHAAGVTDVRAYGQVRMIRKEG